MTKVEVEEVLTPEWVQCLIITNLHVTILAKCCYTASDDIVRVQMSKSRHPWPDLFNYRSSEILGIVKIGD